MSAPVGSDRAWSRLRSPSWAASIGVLVVLSGWFIGIRALDDNSFLTHLATGRIILDDGRVPRSDPYTFSAAGEPWVVQSWLVSAVYGAAERVGGLGAVRLVTAALTALLAGLGWSLLRPIGGLVLRLGAAAVFIAVGAQLWAERPFMVGLLCLAAFVFAMEDRLDARWLVPIGWVWVNSHGSFPLGLGLLAVAALGTRLDGSKPSLELRCLAWATTGIVLGAVVSPLGPGALLFPLELIARQDVLREVTEWRAPTFDFLSQRTFILQVVIAVLALTRRPSYRTALLVGVFTAAALVGSRNLVVASLVLLAVTAPGLDGLGSIRADARPAAARLAGVAGVVMLLLVTVVRLGQRDLDLDRYPVVALAYLEEHAIDTRSVRLAGPEIVGNLIELVYGPQERVFYDDRFDMFPDDVTRAHVSLVRTRPDLQERLDEFDIDLVTVPAGSPTAQVLGGSEAWRTLYLDDRWVLMCRRDAALTEGTRC